MCSGAYYLHMDWKSELLEIENLARRNGLKLDEFLAIAGINRSTWTRWKSGEYLPSMSKWTALQEARATVEKQGSAA